VLPSVKVGNCATIVVMIPEPRDLADAHYVAVISGKAKPPMPFLKARQSIRYFTLELSFGLTGDGTMIGVDLGARTVPVPREPWQRATTRTSGVLRGPD